MNTVLRDRMLDHDLRRVEPLLDLLDCEVLDANQGLVECPGKQLHTTPDAKTDCKLFHNEQSKPKLYCHHTSCSQKIEAANLVIDAMYGSRRSSGNRTSAIRGSNKLQPDRVEEVCIGICSNFPWSYADIIAASDDAINEPVEEHHYQILGLFNDGDIVWCGRDVRDTGRPAHASRFRPVKEWLASASCPGAFICPSTFKPGSFSRRAAQVLARKFLVVESDTLGKDEMGAVFRWLREQRNLILKAIVDTGGKSLHGWFEIPTPSECVLLQKILPALGCDPALFGSAQPCRLPGMMRDGQPGKYQRLIFI